MSDSHEHEAPDPRALRAEALEKLLTDQGLVAPDAIDSIVFLVPWSNPRPLPNRSYPFCTAILFGPSPVTWLTWAK